MKRAYEAIKIHFPGRHVRNVTSLANDSVTGSQIIHVVLNEIDNERKVIVVKVSTPERIKREIKGYSLLTPYFGSSIPELLFTGYDYIIIQFVKKTLATLRELVCDANHKGLSETQVQEIFERLLLVKKEVWSKTYQIGGIIDSSMIRAEMSTTIASLPCSFGNEVNCPVVIRNKKYPSLTNCMEILQHFLDNEPGVPVVAHGDLKGENVLVYKKRRGNVWAVKIIDLEWAGKVDWPEALMRLGKYCSSKTSLIDGRSNYDREGGVVTLHYNVRHNEMCRTLQQRARQFGTEFNTTVLNGQDPNWEKRFDYYLALSLLREIVLLKKRNLPAWLNVPLWGEIVKLVAKHS